MVTVQQLGWMSSLDGRWHRSLSPRDIVLEYRVEDQEQLGHGCHQYHLPGFAPPAQTNSKDVNGGVVPDRGHCVVVQRMVHTEARPPQPLRRHASRCSQSTKTCARRQSGPGDTEQHRHGRSVPARARHRHRPAPGNTGHQDAACRTIRQLFA